MEKSRKKIWNVASLFFLEGQDALQKAVSEAPCVLWSAARWIEETSQGTISMLCLILFLEFLTYQEM